MSASLFDLYVAETCPDELAAMRAARANHLSLFNRFLSDDPTVTEADCIAAKVEVDRAEETARKAFSERFNPSAD